jgi:hypothetical protein
MTERLEPGIPTEAEKAPRGSWRGFLFIAWALAGWPAVLYLHTAWLYGQWGLFGNGLGGDELVLVLTVTHLLGNVSGILALWMAGVRKTLLFVYGLILFSPVMFLLFVVLKTMMQESR